MKGILFIITVASFPAFSCSQDIRASKVPSVVQNIIHAKFTNAANIEWEKKKNLYEAEFDIGNTEYTVLIDTAGKLVQYKTGIKETELPALVATVIRQEYTDYKIDDAAKLEKDGITYYQAELEAKGKKDEQLVFTADGKISPAIIYIK